jgi:hypothetical protein
MDDGGGKDGGAQPAVDIRSLYSTDTWPTADFDDLESADPATDFATFAERDSRARSPVVPHGFRESGDGACRYHGLGGAGYTYGSGWAWQGRLRARSIASLFSQPPSEPDVILVASSGSLVSLSLQLWPVEVDVVMACTAKRYTFPFARYHDFHPERLLPFTLFVQVCQFAYMMHLYPLFASTYFACVF